MEATAEDVLVALACPYEWGEGEAPPGYPVVTWFAHMDESLYMISRKEDGQGWEAYCLYPAVADADTTCDTEAEVKAACETHCRTGEWQ